MTAAPSVLVFDVNETLIDIETLSPLFQQILGDAGAMREWFGQLVMYSMTTALSGCYVDFFTLGQGVLRMLGEIHGTPISDADADRIKQAMMTMPAHPDVADGLGMLRDIGFRLVTLTNSPPNPGVPSPLESAGLGGYFERQFSVDACRTFKPARRCLRIRLPRTGGRSRAVHDGRRARVGHRRRAERGLRCGADHPTGQCAVAARRAAAAVARRCRSAPAGRAIDACSTPVGR